MPKLGLDEIERRARELAREHGLEGCLLTQFGNSQRLYAYVLQDSPGYHFITPDEDGSEMERRTTNEADDVLFWVISDAVSRAVLSNVGPRNSYARAFRPMWFDKELQILGRISREWQRRRKIELDEILKRHPEE